MLDALQKIAGAGRLVASRFLDRFYIAPNGSKCGKNHNTGVDAGCAIPVCAFKAGINTDVDMSGLNTDLDWASLYSDDRSALSHCVKVLQMAINSSLRWATSRFIRYHDGVTCCLVDGVSKCKKYPTIFFNLSDFL